MDYTREYLTYRVESILARETACLKVELHRHPGEVGQPRLDPRLVDYFLETHLATQRTKVISMQRDGLVFYTLSDTPEDGLQPVIQEKLTLYKTATRLKDSPPNVESVNCMFLTAARRASKQRPDARLRLDLPGAPVQSTYAFRGLCLEDGTAFTVFISNDLGWIYPR